MAAGDGYDPGESARRGVTPVTEPARGSVCLSEATKASSGAVGEATERSDARPSRGRSEGAGGADLEKYDAHTVQQGSERDGVEVEKLAQRWASRRDRARVRQFLWKQSSLKRVRACGHVVRRAAGVGVAVDVNAPVGRVAGYRGLVSCGSGTVCPRCALAIGSRRAEELRGALRSWEAQGGRAVFLTLTVSHSLGSRLSDTWSHLIDTWRKLQRRKAWGEVGATGFVRALEVTYSHVTGWHPHLHVVLFLESPEAERNALTWLHRVVGDWIDLNQKAGYRAVRDAQDYRSVDFETRDPGDLGAYLTKQGRKWSVAEEATMWAAKKGRGGSSSPMQLLSAAVKQVEETGDTELLSLWWEWEKASHGRRMFVWSLGLKDLLGVDEMEDEKIAEEVDDGAEDAEDLDLDQGTEEIGGILAEDYMRASSRSYRVLMRLLEAVEGAEPGPAVVEAFEEAARTWKIPVMTGEAWESHVLSMFKVNMRSNLRNRGQAPIPGHLNDHCEAGDRVEEDGFDALEILPMVNRIAAEYRARQNDANGEKECFPDVVPLE